MFTGIVQHLGSTRSVERVDFGARLVIDLAGWTHVPTRGESIAVNGCCLTVADDPGDGGAARFDVIRQTLANTTLGGLRAGDPVNLEPAVTPGSLLGGHIVQGHVDGVGVVRHVRRDEEEWRLRIEPPPAMLDFIVDRGSIAVDGVSLTVAELQASTFEVALIPTTIELTTLGRVESGARVNIETDYVAKTVVHWLQRQRAEPLARKGG